jgi:hypothetical protein
MLNKQKILKLIFSLLSIILFLEISFLIFYQKISNNKKNIVNDNQLYQYIFEKYTIPYIKKLGFLADEKLLTNFIITEQYEGIVENIEFNNEENTKMNDFPYVLKIHLASKSNAKINTTRLLNENDLRVIKIYDQTGKKIKFTELKKSDFLLISFTSDYLKNPKENLISGVIKKLK